MTQRADQPQAPAAPKPVVDQADPDALVYMKHPQGEAVGGPIPRHALSDFWASKGWAECAPPEEIV